MQSILTHLPLMLGGGGGGGGGGCYITTLPGPVDLCWPSALTPNIAQPESFQLDFEAATL